jgi:hypothetical protein
MFNWASCPISVGMAPANAFPKHKTLSSRLVYQSINLSNNVLTGQSVYAQIEHRHSRAQAELRRDYACASRRSFLVRGTLVNLGTMSTQKSYRSIRSSGHKAHS